MFTIHIAELNIGIDNHFPYVYEQCRAYLTDKPYDFAVSVTLEEIKNEWQNSTDEVKNTIRCHEGYSESICLFRKICYALPRYDALLFHGATVAYNGAAYTFSAPSGTGKSTHLALWMRNYPSLTIINGDKPIFRQNAEGQFIAYGSPWAGKEGWQSKYSAPVRGICFLRRAPENSIEKLDDAAAGQRALRQILYPKDPEMLLRTLRLTDELVRSCPTYLLSCNISKEAADLSFSTMTGEK